MTKVENVCIVIAVEGLVYQAFKKPFSALLCVFFTLTACSFNYSEGSGSSVPPDMTFSRTKATRYSDGKKTMEITAESLEIYNPEKIWAGERISFTEYQENGKEPNSSSAGLMLLDEKNEVYTLGDGVVFNLPEDNMKVKAGDLRWNKKEGFLSSPVDGSVEIESGGITAGGTGFFADTKDRTYRFSRAVSGKMTD